MSRLKESKTLLERVLERLPVVSTTFSVVGSLVFNTPSASAEPGKVIDPLTQCPVGENPTFILGFKQLHEIVGDATGDPLECEHGNLDLQGNLINKDTHQRTSKGLNYWRASINQTIYTDGYNHWSNNNGEFLYWVGVDIEPPATATLVIEQSPKPPTLESFITTSTLIDQISLGERGQSKLEVRSSEDSAFSATLNQATKQQLGKLLAEPAIQYNYRNIEVIAVKSPADTPVEWASQGMYQANLGFYRGTDVLDLYSIGSFNAVRNGDDLVFFFALRPDLKTNDPTVIRAVNDTIAQKLFTAALYNGNLSAPNPLQGKSEFLQLAGQDALQVSLTVAQN